MTRTDTVTTIAERVHAATTSSCATTAIIYVTEPGWDERFAKQGLAHHARTATKKVVDTGLLFANGICALTRPVLTVRRRQSLPLGLQLRHPTRRLAPVQAALLPPACAGRRRR